MFSKFNMLAIAVLFAIVNSASAEFKAVEVSDADTTTPQCSYRMKFVDDLEYEDTIITPASSIVVRDADSELARVTRLEFNLDALTFDILVRKMVRAQGFEDATLGQAFFDRYLELTNSGELISGALSAFIPAPISGASVPTLTLRGARHPSILVLKADNFTIESDCGYQVVKTLAKKVKKLGKKQR